ncbi:hypothetical protein VHE8714_01643 [Vibrio splendidus]|nr:hypothetical protein VHE8714_01643 [Vibrio splendidus]
MTNQQRYLNVKSRDIIDVSAFLLLSFVFLTNRESINTWRLCLAYLAESTDETMSTGKIMSTDKIQFTDSAEFIEAEPQKYHRHLQLSEMFQEQQWVLQRCHCLYQANHAGFATSTPLFRASNAQFAQGKEL